MPYGHLDNASPPRRTRVKTGAGAADPDSPTRNLLIAITRRRNSNGPIRTTRERARHMPP
jgi:hypothetical protein